MSRTAAKRRKAKAKATGSSKPRPRPQLSLVTDLVTVDNPAPFAERVVNPFVTAARSLRDDPIGQMHSKGQLGAIRTADEYRQRKGGDREPSKHYPGDNRLEAARRFQALWEAAGFGRIKSIDLLAVGGGDPSRRSAINDRSKQAAAQLRQWEKQLGDTGYRLLRMILIDKLTTTQAAKLRHGIATGTAINVTGHRLKECLDEIA